MPTRLQLLQEDSHYRVLAMLATRPEVSQRQLSQALGVSLGSVNYSLRALVARGLIEMQKFKASAHKQSYAYLLTPQGVLEKASLTRRFLQRKQQEYATLQLEIAALQQLVAAQAEEDASGNGH